MKMESRSLKFVAESCAGELVSGSPEATVRRICTDSRQLEGGDLFVALAGERFDGHDYLLEVAGKGAVAALVEPKRTKVPPLALHCGMITVANTRAALGQLAERYRRDFTLPIVAIGGSNGKTTTKELVASVLRQKYATLSSEASFNNDIGVPLTLLRLSQSHQAAVLEVGTNHPGELAPLVRMIEPRLGVITSIGREHLEFFGGIQGVAEEEGWLAELLPAEGTLFVNGDSEWAARLAGRSRARTVRVGVQAGNDWSARAVMMDGSGTTFEVSAPRPAYAGEYHIKLLGRHQVINALLALAVGSELGVGREELQRGLADCQLPKLRLQLWEVNGVRVLDDSYNANVDSMLAALQTLSELPGRGRRIAVLGDMAELGRHSEPAHREVGAAVARSGVAQLFAVGKMAGVTAAAAREAGLQNANQLADSEEAARVLREFVKAGDLVLIKASRASRLERVGEALRAGLEALQR
jgi:UDP-N-acetylmuramoyl-tripeptide--D-alanyl-D-alanine ligase